MDWFFMSKLVQKLKYTWRDVRLGYNFVQSKSLHKIERLATRDDLINHSRKKWEDADYTWENLASKIIQQNIYTNLQDYWRTDANGSKRTECELIKSGEIVTIKGKKYHIAHAPLYLDSESENQFTEKKDQNNK
ncbi:MAG: hypothetical protein ACK41P_00795 [Asticcacaulis sp.]